METYPIRFCTGGCKSSGHAPHVYTVDPVDGDLGKAHVCPGNTTGAFEVREWLDGETGEPTGHGFIYPVADIIAA